MNLLKDFIGLFFPNICLVCGASLYRGEEVVCTRCQLHLPETNFHLHADNPVSRLFWGRVNLEKATSLYFYKKGGSVQQLIHQFKYHGHQEVGTYFGKYYGNVLLKSGLFNPIDFVIPIPLHPDKLKKRGFNQAEIFALGLAESMETIVDNTAVARQVATSTQTKKSRYKRWENVNEIFRLTNPALLENKNILLVDDVITTGSTMEACLQTLGKVPGIKLNAVSIAFAHH